MRIFGLRAVLMNEAGGEGGGGAIAVAEPVSTALVPSVGSDTGADTGSDEVTDLATTDGTGDASPARRVNPGLALLKGHADPEIKKFAGAVHQAMAVREELRKLFPGQSPIAATKALQTDMIGLAGRYYNTPDPRDAQKRTGIQQIKDRMAEFEEVDMLFYGGDPKLLEGMTSDDDGKAAFAKLAPHMKAKWRQIAPNAWAADAARQILADAKDSFLLDKDGKETSNRADVPLRVERAYELLKEGASPQDVALARQQIVAIYHWLHRVEGLASLAPEVFAAATNKDGDTKLQERERRLAERESESRTREWGQARQSMANQAVSKVFAAMTKGRTVSAEDNEDVQSLFARRFDASIKQREPNADENRKRFLDTDDREGYLAYEKYLVDTYGIPALKMEVEKLLKRMAPAKPGAAAASTTTATTATGTTRAAPVPQGYFKLTAKPPSHVVSNVGRTQDMVFKKQAVLRLPHEGKPAGTRVTW